MAPVGRILNAAGVTTHEVDRPDRSDRRRRGKSDAVDAEMAARAVISGRQATAQVRCAAWFASTVAPAAHSARFRTTAMNTLKQIVVHAPPVLREALHALTDHGLLTLCAGLRPGPIDTLTASAKHTLRALARRWMALTEEIAIHDQHLARLTTRHHRPSVRASVWAPTPRPNC